ncbi:nucleoid occlusion protein [Selenomonadales bacterium OttesenSCG-928-I06]|nr:nucleoid occlusion protein [Selenomonadales bacterium OttesenSCG-928-I06]
MKGLAKLFGIKSKEEPQQNEYISDADNSQANQESSLASTTEPVSETEKDQSISVLTSAIVPNPFQPRKVFTDENLQELAASIKEFGILQPLIVRKHGTAYQLIAGERRLRAATIAGLSLVPVIVKDINEQEMAEIAMIENLQREDLNYWEEAEGLLKLTETFNFTQEQLAKRIGRNQSTIANKLRLLKLAPKVKSELYNNNLSERHARALLKLNDENIQLEVLNSVIKNNLNVRQTEDLIETYLKNALAEKEEPEKNKQNFRKIVKDVRIFLNTINSVATQMKKSGLKIKYDQQIEDDYVIITMKVKNDKAISK